MKQIINGKEYEMTESHSEKDIYEGCIALMESLVGRFEEYLEFLGVDTAALPEDERFKASFSNMTIVESLFLMKTSHSGGTSQALKCKELGIDPCKYVEFAFDELECDED